LAFDTVDVTGELEAFKAVFRALAIVKALLVPPYLALAVKP